MKEETRTNSRLPIVLTRRPRHRIRTGDWELEFRLGDRSGEIAQEQAVAKLLILGTALEQTERNRTELRRRSSVQVRLEGLEAFLRELNRLAILCLGFDKTHSISRLAVRALHDFISAVEGALAGVHVTVFESMRDVMEIELLIREFQNQPHRIREWIESDNTALKKKFAPGVLRQLHAKRLGVKPQDLPEHADYQGHSIGVHVTPFAGTPPFGTRDMIADCSDPFAVDACFWEIFGHAHSLLTRLLDFLGGSSSHFEKDKRLQRFAQAYGEIKKSQALYYGILELMGRHLERVPDHDDIAFEIDIDVIPEEYRSAFLGLCDGRPLNARVFLRMRQP